MNDRPEIIEALSPWKILIVDDDEDMHTITKMALRNIQFHGRKVEFIDAYSGEEALSVLRETPSIGLILLDIIMESDDAGLLAAKRIRDEGFNLVRIILRTGFPGEAPEKKIIVDYDIHDYKDKTGLSVQKLYTTVISALRSYDDLAVLESHRRSLQRVLESVSWFDFNAIQRYVSGMLAEFSNLVNLGSEHITMVSRPSSNPSAEPMVLLSTENWQTINELIQSQSLSNNGAELIRKTLNSMQSQTASAGKTLFTRSHGVDLVVFADEKDAYIQADEVLLEVFLMKVCQAISNQQTFSDMANERNCVLFGLALRAEKWNVNAEYELRSLGLLASALTERLHRTLSFTDEIDDRFRRDINIAATMRDIGNSSLPEGLLSDTGKYKPDQRKRMEQHVNAGLTELKVFKVTQNSAGALKLALQIISSHHENYDGSGYPKGLVGEGIPLAARLVSVVDSYIAMVSPRPHRVAMTALDARSVLKVGAGVQYDPNIVQAFFELDERVFKKLQIPEKASD